MVLYFRAGNYSPLPFSYHLMISFPASLFNALFCFRVLSTSHSFDISHRHPTFVTTVRSQFLSRLHHRTSTSLRNTLTGDPSFHSYRSIISIQVKHKIDISRVTKSPKQPVVKMLSYEVFSEQNANTTNAIIEHFSASEDFLTLAQAEGALILQRDEEDASKLQKGIDIAKEKGVIDPNFVPEEYITVDVLGKSPDQVADEILGRVRGESGTGAVVVLCGLSGTGKGTTVAKLQEKLQKEDGKHVVCWSNGNIFRSVTLLAATWCEQNGCDGFDASKALTKENLASFMSMLEFGKFNGKFDTKISGLGIDVLVSEVQNTDLKVPKVSKNIPTVAEVTQGEVRGTTIHETHSPCCFMYYSPENKYSLS
ncbi:hypothetical protein ACHAXS_006447 [Conticribra weissflogii]